MFLSREREPDRERGPQRRAVLPADLAAVLLGDLPGDRQAQAGALRLRREELLEEPRPHVLGDPAAGVRDGDLDRVAVEAALDRQLAAARQGLEPVLHEI